MFQTIKNRKLIKNNEEVYHKFLKNLSQNPKHEYLRQLTIEAGRNYYAALRKEGQVLPEDEEAISRDISLAEVKNLI
jgi:hypothetical protein